MDVDSLKENIFVECGDTKIYEFLGNRIKIGILQYDSEEMVWFRTAYTFFSFMDSMVINI
jgi:predicted GNAT superfamily acetyltransferase